MDKSDMKGVRLQKRIAMGDKDALNVGDFDCDHMDSHAAGEKPSSGKPKNYLGDHERGARPPINGNQANPDHGYK